MISAAALFGLLCIASLVMFAAYLMRELGAGDLAQLMLAIFVFAAVAAFAGALFA